MVYKNLAYGTVLTAPSPATSGTSLVLNSGEGARFPQPSTDGSFYVTIFPASADPTPANAEIVLVTARITDTLTIDREEKSTTARTVVVGDRVIQGIYAEDIMGSNSFTGGETPSGTVNGSNVTFTLASTPVSGTLALYRDGQLMTGGGADYTLTTNSIAFVTAPVTGSVLLAFYYFSNAGTANADTVDGLNASDTPSDGKLISDYGGWQKVSGSWTYASASTITVPSGAASYYQKGDRIRWKQGGAYKYGAIVTVADTLLTIAVNTDYTVANSAITDMYYSHQANPLGYPHWFAFTPTFTGITPTGGTAKFSIVGKLITIFLNGWTQHVTASTSCSFTIPVTASDSFYQGFPCAINNAAAWQQGWVTPSGASLVVYAGVFQSAWSSSNAAKNIDIAPVTFGF